MVEMNFLFQCNARKIQPTPPQETVKLFGLEEAGDGENIKKN